MKFVRIFIFLVINSHILSASHIIVGSGKGKYPEKTSMEIQKAIDDLAFENGGTVELAEGEFILHSTIYPKSHITLRGQGEKTVLKKAPVYSYSKLLKPARQGDKVLWVEHPDAFYEGQGVNIGATQIGANRTTITKIEKICGKKITIKDPIDFTCQAGAYMASNFSCIFVNFASHVTIRDLVIDGSRQSTPYIASWKIGGLKTWEASHVHLENLEIKNTCGDGLTLGSSDYAVLKKLYCHDNDLIALHLANGSKYAILSDSIAHNAGGKCSFNGAGIFLCWNVQNCIIRNNSTYNNTGGGISLGRNDNNNIFINNTAYSNSNGGIRFRNDPEETCKNNIFVSTKLSHNIPSNVLVEGPPENAFFDPANQASLKHLSVRFLSEQAIAYFVKLNTDLEEILIIDQNICDLIDTAWHDLY